VYASMSLSASDRARLMPVLSERDIEYLVKESELFTGKPGREFVVTGAERLSYRVECQGAGLCVRRMHGGRPISEPMVMHPHDLADHTLGKALRCGLLFTLHLY
jgi:hypothetical protein